MKDKKSAKLNPQHKQDQNGHLSPSTFAKLLDQKLLGIRMTYQCNLGDQLGDVLHWIRQIVALVCGLLWGAIPLVGGIWLVTFLVISSGIIYGYYAIILKVDEEEFGGHGPLLQEGLFASVTLFLLAWTLVYSLAHF
ncbi:putative rab5-interacting protein family [Helianthus annuus]|nr:putative rab5-interacting protein family [Helianthus annuus]